MIAVLNIIAKYILIFVTCKTVRFFINLVVNLPMQII